MARIYTRTGDEGDTGLIGGQRVPKCDARIDAGGEIDEVSSALGVVLACRIDSDLAEVLAQAQTALFVVGADLAAPYETGDPSTVLRLEPGAVEYIEAVIDRLEVDLEPLTRFIMPGGTPAAAAVHLARAICRRAERRVVSLSRVAEVNPEIVRYLNRLGDALFVIARTLNARAGVPDVPWTA